jgi:hypothetical protein
MWCPSVSLLMYFPEPLLPYVVQCQTFIVSRCYHITTVNIIPHITLYTTQFSCNCAKLCSSSLTLSCPAVRRHLTFNFYTQVCYQIPSNTTAVKLSQAVNRDKIGLKSNILETCCIYFIRVVRTGFSEIGFEPNFNGADYLRGFLCIYLP